MRIDPGSAYLELRPSVLHINMKGGGVRREDAVTLHWKDAARWRKLTFYGSNGEDSTLGSILTELGGWLDTQGSLDAALADATSKVAR